jgi:hypothetical protein
MNYKSLLLFFFICSFSSAFAQKPEVNSIESEMSLGKRPGFSLMIEQASEKMVRQLWSDYVKSTFDARLKSTKGSDDELAEGASKKGISTEKFNLYSQLKSAGNGVMLTVWFDLGGSFLSKEQSASGAEQAKKILIDFAYTVQREQAQEVVLLKEKEVKEAERTYEKLKKTGESLADDIKSYEQKLETSKLELQKNSEEQVKAKSEIETKREAAAAALKAKEAIGN